MKRLVAIAVSLTVLIVTACGHETMPVPDGPVSKERLAEAMAECGMRNDLILEENEYNEYPGMSTTSFGIRPPENERLLCMSLLSHTMGADRSLGVSVVDVDWQEGLTQEECEQVIRMATILFGGFTDDMQVQRKFSKQSDYSEPVYWEAQLEGITCVISYNPENIIPMRIVFATDIEKFTIPKQ